MPRFCISVLTLSVFILGFSACDSSDGGPLFTVTTVNLTALENEDVYFIFTNPSSVDNAPVAPSVDYSEITGAVNASRELQSPGLFKTAVSLISEGVIDAQLWRIPEGLSPESGGAFRASGVTYSYETPTEAVGDPRVFNDAINDSDVSAVCRKKVEAVDGRTLFIYVADDCWEPDNPSGPKAYSVNQDMVDALSDRFLSTDTEKVIWDWMTDIFGEAWGPHSYTNRIGSGAEDYITILLYDIADDGNNVDYTSGGIVGYFSSGNNYLKSEYSDSNERLMFAMDAVMYADADTAGSWTKDDYWPRIIFSTLAHEFQHMIQYYQKQIVFGISSSEALNDTWLNEMCSMAAEDLLADKIGVPGPRGVDPDVDDGSDDGKIDDSVDCYSSRLSTYNYWNDDSLTLWGGNGDDILRSYASAYSFGAFIARNYGGAALLQDIVQSEWTDERAVTEAIAEQLDYGNPTFKDLLVEWAEAAISSYTVVNQADVKTYNRGIFVESSPSDPGGSGYKLGSINLYNYDAYDGVNDPAGPGPVPYGNEAGTFNPGSLEATPPAANVIFLVGRNLCGDYSLDVEIPAGMVLTVFRK